MKFTAKNNNNVATKDDIKAIHKIMATKTDLKKLEKDLRHDMAITDNKIDKLITDSLNTHERLQKIEETMATKDDINKVLGAVDMAIGQYQEIKIEQLSNLSAHQRFEADTAKLKIHAELQA